ncbi:MAG TPA: L-sorbosone dehydrogenase [Planctomycetaceae bacterium]|nr:L-sorbosone dehydrogenase [Planctomycetaceae bacterium]
MTCLRFILAIFSVVSMTTFALAQKGKAKVKKGSGLGVTSPEGFSLANGFAIDLLHEVASETEGSWVSLTVDPKGRLIACDQYGGLFRIDVANEPVKVEKLQIDFVGAQGLLCAFDALYANVNAGGPTGGLWRLTDTDGDDQYDKKEHLVPLNAGSEHGPHAIILSPDSKRILFCAGNNTNLPKDISRSRVPKIWSEDHLLGRMPDARGHNADRLAPGGFVVSLMPDGSDLEVIATGFRNQYDIALNRQGELFTYDADMEWDVGVPWYRPTRVNHVVSGVDFGWRNGTGKWPAYYADSFGSVVDIGPGSPTGIVFGYGAKFPAKYQNALYLCDWSYGNIYAVHMDESGSTYTGIFETFATAAPLPATDLVIRPQDGAMYLTVGGRRTQSGLYRIRYVGDESTEPVNPQVDATATAMRATRHELEKLHVAPDAAKLPMVLEHLGHTDRAIRSAARIALEHLPVDQWKGKLTSLNEPHATITAVVALARTGQPSDREQALALLSKLDWSKLDETQQLDLTRAYSLAFLRLGKPTDAETDKILAQTDAAFPGSSESVNRELSQVLIFLGAPKIVDRAVAMMKDAPSQEDQIHYAMALRGVRDGWSEPLRRLYFSRFIDMSGSRGGMSFGGFLANIRKVAIENLPDDEALKTRLADVLNPPAGQSSEVAMPPRELVKAWTVDELAEAVSSNDHKFDFEQGKSLFAAAQCYKCHRVGVQGGILGPDLTGAGRRFTPKDLLVSTIEPSKEISDQYGATQFLTDDGQVVVGRVINMNGKNLSVLTNMLDPSSLTSLNRDNIEEARPAKTSMMPSGLLDTFTKEEIIQLMTYLRAGGQSEHPLYKSSVAQN